MLALLMEYIFFGPPSIVYISSSIFDIYNYKFLQIPDRPLWAAYIYGLHPSPGHMRKHLVYTACTHAVGQNQIRNTFLCTRITEGHSCFINTLLNYSIHRTGFHTHPSRNYKLCSHWEHMTSHN